MLNKIKIIFNNLDSYNDHEKEVNRFLKELKSDYVDVDTKVTSGNSHSRRSNEKIVTVITYTIDEWGKTCYVNLKN